MRNYSIGALIIFIISIGSAAIAYGGGFIVFNVLNLPAWIFGPLGIYFFIFAFISDNHFYYIGWSILFLAIAYESIFYKLVNIFVVIGTLLISLALVASSSFLIKPKPKQK